MPQNALLIKSTYTEKSGETGKWHKFQEGEIQPYILGIETGFIPERINSDVLNSLISGVPSAWARAKLFWFAFEYINSLDPNIQTSGLMDYFKVLVSEWKGLIALLALYQDRIHFSNPVILDTEGTDLYDITGAFGRMLQEDKDLWSNQKRLASNPGEMPYLQLIYYKNQLIGATSPYTIVFTGVDYTQLDNISDVKWYRDGKFEEPMLYLQNDFDKVQKLYLFLKNISEQNLSGFERNINSQRKGNVQMKLSGLKGYIKNWTDELKKQFPALRDTGPFTKYSNVEYPFDGLLFSEQKVFVRKDGSLTMFPPDEENLEYDIRDLQSILNNNDTLVGWYTPHDYPRQKLENSPVFYLRVPNTKKQKFGPGEFLYFALPLSMMGIKLFRNRMKTLLEGSQHFKLSATINDQFHLEVNLFVEIDGERVELNAKEYKIILEEGNKNIFLWPNFTSDNWSAYYVYSEYPSNSAGLKFIPFFKQKSNMVAGNVSKPGGLLEIEDIGVLYHNSDERDKTALNLKTDLIVRPVGQESIPVYEILESNKPVAGLEIRRNDKVAGYLILKEGNNLIDRTNDDTALSKAIVGIDFGSNNTCAYYSVDEKSTFPVTFSNRRLALVGFDNVNIESPAYNHELLFFQNEEGFRGQIKSWLHEHHPLAIAGRDLADELIGGVPVNEMNIQVDRMDRYNIVTQAGKLHYNMKWLSDEIGRQRKAAFLKTIWLQICADLYNHVEHRCIPVELRWSYPGALSEFDLSQYKLIFKQLSEITPVRIRDSRVPVRVEEPITESEAVCRYALGKQEAGLTENKLFLGLDIGGTTSDVLILAKVNDGQNINFKLLKQGSIRIAAGVYYDAIITSSHFRKALFDFYETKHREFGINVQGIGDLLDPRKKENAPFYLNSIFDQLEDDQFNSFYTFIGQRAQFIFTIPAFVTGLLLYYTGMLVAKAMKDEKNLGKISIVDLLIFGKGGRLFFWLDTFPGKQAKEDYFVESFRKGLGAGFENIMLTQRIDVLTDNKSEVAIGLVANQNSRLIIEENLRHTSDIFGERGIQILINGEKIAFNPDDTLVPEYFIDPNMVIYPDEFQNFNEFLKVFHDFVSIKSNMVKNINTLKEKVTDMKSLLTAYLGNDSEWKKAQTQLRETQKFEYRFPFFIAEGLTYLNQVIIPQVFND
ncbi:MAG: hypothetical protein WCK34_00765 [Bacteroidota bacterium]